MGTGPAKACVLVVLLVAAAAALAGSAGCAVSHTLQPPATPWPTAVPSPDELANRQAREFRYIAVEVSELNNTCALRDDGAAICWVQGNLIPPATGHYTMISVGPSHACGVKTDGHLECWGENDFGQSAAPAGEFQSVSAGYTQTCGIRIEGVVECWGGDERTGLTDRLDCAARTAGAKECGGGDENTEAPAGVSSSVSAGDGRTCGIRPNGSVECWGRYNVADSPPDSVKFQSIVPALPTCAACSPTAP